MKIILGSEQHKNMHFGSNYNAWYAKNKTNDFISIYKNAKKEGKFDYLIKILPRMMTVKQCIKLSLYVLKKTLMLLDNKSIYRDDRIINVLEIARLYFKDSKKIESEFVYNAISDAYCFAYSGDNFNLGILCANLAHAIYIAISMDNSNLDRYIMVATFFTKFGAVIASTTDILRFSMKISDDIFFISKMLDYGVKILKKGKR